MPGIILPAAALSTALLREGRGPALEGPAPALEGPALALDGPAPALDEPALNLGVLLAFGLPLPELVWGSLWAEGSGNPIG